MANKQASQTGDVSADVLTSGTYRPRTEETVTVWPLDEKGEPTEPPDGWVYLDPARRDHVTLVDDRNRPVRDVDGNAASLAPGEALVEGADGTFTVLPADVHNLYLNSRERV